MAKGRFVVQPVSSRPRAQGAMSIVAPALAAGSSLPSREADSAGPRGMALQAQGRNLGESNTPLAASHQSGVSIKAASNRLLTGGAIISGPRAVPTSTAAMPASARLDFGGMQRAGPSQFII